MRLHADWFLRFGLASVFLVQGFGKFPLDPNMAAAFGLPLFMWGAAGVTEVTVSIILLSSGFIRGWGWADHLTRFAGLATVAVMIGVIDAVGPDNIKDIILYDNLHVLLLSIGAYFAISGNK